MVAIISSFFGRNIQDPSLADKAPSQNPARHVMCQGHADLTHGRWGWRGQHAKGGPHDLAGSPAAAAAAPQGRQTPACATWHLPAMAEAAARVPLYVMQLLGEPLPWLSPL